MRSDFSATVMRAMSILPNNVVIFGYNALKRTVAGKVIERHYISNREHLKKMIEPDAYIEDQNTADWEEVLYGVNPFNKEDVHASYNICGVIATFNALLALGEHVDSASIARLIRIYEQKGVALKGLLGTTPNSIASFFKHRGYKVKMISTSDKAKIDAFGKEHDTYLVIVMNNKKTLEDYMHTVNISIDDEGLRRTFFVHNGRERRVVRVNDSLSRAIAAINKHGSNTQNRALIIMGIDKDNNK
ncbi:MAG: hypothetical protein IJV29_06010 [Butyrivibrio sp.]|nr:hypothetical protein [Butyrivibrio sp.]